MKQNLNVNKAVLETNKHELGLSLKSPHEE